MLLLLDLFKKESDLPKMPIITTGVASGIASSAILAAINQAAQGIADYEDIARPFFIFLISLTLFIYARKHSLAQATLVVEESIRKVRLRVADKIRHSELHFIEGMGKGEIYSHLTQDANLVSQSGLTLISSLQAFIVLFFCLLYIATLSPLGFIIILTGLVIGGVLYFQHFHNVSAEILTSIEKETAFFEQLNHILDGFKETRLNQMKSDAVFKQLEKISHETEQIKVNTGIKFVTNIMFSRVFGYIMLGAIVFIIPMFNPEHHTVVITVTATMLFIMAPIETIASAIPVVARANVAVTNIIILEKMLDNVSDYKDYLTVSKQKLQQFNEFKALKLQNIQYQYNDIYGQKLFQLGSLDLTIKRNEIIYIVGGNGSGKSTLLKVLAGLYHPQVGHIQLDNELINRTNYAAFHELFSVVFADFHLFDRLYGVADIDEAFLNELLKLMGLEHKTQYMDGQFTHLELSAGQRRRLAFIVSMIDDKPIYLFDELTADQDPTFKHYFYKALIPNLRAEGKTVILTTHDEKYLDTADRVLKMEDGQLKEVEV
ncbi:cyclic peptide export ABC transporter [Candidatus Albibeggiatoa sp. nov. NOAA]|uniref:cyclic peptide export ABC transporter n=1 Tax=Candidatus Albibeggiatoa sp. nov. NOAA TaxID=3162724 RepID=UPI003303D01D|nr:cyclic peptide export ABC transporter [Thiotrichaceae bacterium]